MLTSLTFWHEIGSELKGTRHLVLAWVPIILAAMIIGGIVAVAVNTILRQLGLDIPYIAEFIGSLAGALALAFVLKAMATIPPIIMAARMIGTHARTRWRVPLSSKPTSCQNVRDVSKDDQKEHNAETIWLFGSIRPAS